MFPAENLPTFSTRLRFFNFLIYNGICAITVPFPTTCTFKFNFVLETHVAYPVQAVPAPMVVMSLFSTFEIPGCHLSPLDCRFLSLHDHAVKICKPYADNE